MKYRTRLEEELHGQMNEDYTDKFDGKLCRFFNISEDMRNELTEHQMDEYRNELVDILIDATDDEFKTIWKKYLPNIDIDKVIVVYEQQYDSEYEEDEYVDFKEYMEMYTDSLEVCYEDSEWYNKIQVEE